MAFTREHAKVFLELEKIDKTGNRFELAVQRIPVDETEDFYRGLAWGCYMSLRGRNNQYTKTHGVPLSSLRALAGEISNQSC